MYFSFIYVYEMKTKRLNWNWELKFNSLYFQALNVSSTVQQSFKICLTQTEKKIHWKKKHTSFKIAQKCQQIHKRLTDSTLFLLSKIDK